MIKSFEVEGGDATPWIAPTTIIPANASSNSFTLTGGILTGYAFNDTITADFLNVTPDLNNQTVLNINSTTAVAVYNAGSSATYNTGGIGSYNSSQWTLAFEALPGDTIVGGGGNDTLTIGVAATLNDGSFANVSGFEALSLSGSSSVYLGSLAAAAGITSVYGGSANDSITQGSGDTMASYINAGSGNDLVTVDFGGASSNGFPSQTLTASQALSDLGFNYGGAGFNNGFQYDSLNFSPGVETTTQNEPVIYIDRPVTISGANGSSFDLKEIDLYANENTQSSKYYSSQSGGTVVLDGYNSSGELVGSSTFTGSGYSYNASRLLLNWNDVASLTAAPASGGPDSYDYFAIQALITGPVGVPAFNGNTIVGGDGNDTLNIGVASTLKDSDFMNVSGFEALSLSGNSNVTLGANATLAGINTVYTGDSLSLTITETNPLTVSTTHSYDTVTAGDHANLTLTGYYSTNDSVSVGTDSNIDFSGDRAFADGSTLSAGDRSTLSFSGYDGNGAYINLGAYSSLSAATAFAVEWGSIIHAGDNSTLNFSHFIAGSRYDRIIAGANADLIFSDSYSGYNGDDISAGDNSTLSFSGSGSGTLDRMISGGNNSTLTFSGTGSGSNSTLSLGGNDLLSFSGTNSGQNDLIEVAYASLLATDSITGGANDTLVITNADTITDSAFANDSFAGSAALTLAANSSVTLGSLALAAGIETILGGDGVSLSDSLDGQLVIMGDSLRFFADGNFGAMSDTISAGSHSNIYLHGYTSSNYSSITAGSYSTVDIAGQYGGEHMALSLGDHAALALHGSYNYSGNGYANTITAGSDFSMYDDLIFTDWNNSISAGDGATLVSAGLATTYNDTISFGDDASLSFSGTTAGCLDTIRVGSISTLNFSGTGSGSFDSIIAGSLSYLSFSGPASDHVPGENDTITTGDLSLIHI